MRDTAVTKRKQIIGPVIIVYLIIDQPPPPKYHPNSFMMLHNALNNIYGSDKRNSFPKHESLITHRFGPEMSITICIFRIFINKAIDDMHATICNKEFQKIFQ